MTYDADLAGSRGAVEARPARGPVWRLETARLVVRAWRAEDALAWERAAEGSRDHIRPWLSWATSPPLGVEGRARRIQAAREQLARRRDAALGVFGPGEDEVLGGVGLHRIPGLASCTLSYWLAAPHLGRGYATEAAAALTRVAFEVDRVRRVEIHVDADNVRSAAVPDRLGFRLVATRRQRVNVGVPDLVERPIRVYRLTPRTYRGSAAAETQLAAFDRTGSRLL